MRYAMIPLFLAGSLFMGIQGCPPGDDDDCPPPDGFLAEGSWGGEHWLVQVGSDGIVYMETDCAHGATGEPVVTEAGAVNYSILMQGEGGPAPYPEENQYSATVTGSVCDNTFKFTLVTEDGGYSEGVVTLGEEAQLFKCL